jgi:ankyrin repeat protein
MTKRTKGKSGFNAAADRKTRASKPAAYTADDVALLERRLLFSNAAKNGVMDTFRRMPREEQLSVLDWQNGTGVTPLMNACRNGHEEAAAHLLHLNANVALYDANGWSALTFAAARGATGIVRLLLDAKADMDWQDTERWTPLMAAASKRHIDTARLLLDRGCRTDARGVDGLKARDIARDEGCIVIVAMIEMAEAARLLRSELEGINGGLPQNLAVSAPLRLLKKKP